MREYKMAGWLGALLAGVMSVSMSGGVEAGWRHHDRDHDRGSFSDRARVVEVEPILKQHRRPVERRECRDVESYHDRGASPGEGLIAGTLIGGVLGNQIGGGSGRRVATALGALVGAAVGHDVARHSWREPRRVVEERCTSYRAYEEDERVVGYRVTYRYRGRLFTRRMSYDPGRWVRVEVDVDPKPRHRRGDW